MQRRTIHFTGHVQGVGFRYRAQQIARQFNLSGYVRNLDDGRVELVIEAEPDEIDRLVASINASMGDYIHKVDSHASPATSEFRDFAIRH